MVTGRQTKLKMGFTSESEDLHFAEAKMFVALPLVFDVDELAGLTKTPIAPEEGFLGLEIPAELCAGFVQGLVPLEELDHEDSQGLERRPLIWKASGHGLG